MGCCTRTDGPVLVTAVVAGLAATGVLGMFISGAIEGKVQPAPLAVVAEEPPPQAGAPDKPSKPDKTADEKTDDPLYVLGYTLNRIDGTEQDLTDFEGQVILIINVASRCGFTPQYASLEKLYEDRHEDGFTILAFPANDFKHQEPGTNKEIAEFCTEKFGVTFPMFEKIHVLGDDRSPLYRQLVDLPDPLGGDPEWNFTKFLVGRDGRVAARFGPSTDPLDKEFLAKLDELMKVKK